jgi:integrase
MLWSTHSFRHTCATSQIRDGVDVYTLAINMRTSVRMIEMYYSDIIPEDRAKLLEGNLGAGKGPAAFSEMPPKAALHLRR